jgi:hypothetical protein
MWQNQRTVDLHQLWDYGSGFPAISNYRRLINIIPSIIRMSAILHLQKLHPVECKTLIFPALI